MITRWKTSLIVIANALLVGCGTSSSVSVSQRAAIRLTIHWPKAASATKATRTIAPSADTIKVTASNEGTIIAVETATKPSDGSASHMVISVPLAKTRLDAVAFSSADPNSILDRGGAPSAPGSYLPLTPGSANDVEIDLTSALVGTWTMIHTYSDGSQATDLMVIFSNDVNGNFFGVQQNTDGTLSGLLTGVQTGTQISMDVTYPVEDSNYHYNQPINQPGIIKRTGSLNGNTLTGQEALEAGSAPYPTGTFTATLQ